MDALACRCAACGWTGANEAGRFGSSTAHPSLLLFLFLLLSLLLFSSPFLFFALRCASSCAGPGGLTERNTCRETKKQRQRLFIWRLKFEYQNNHNNSKGNVKLELHKAIIYQVGKCICVFAGNGPHFQDPCYTHWFSIFPGVSLCSQVPGEIPTNWLCVVARNAPHIQPTTPNILGLKQEPLIWTD